MRVVLCHGVFDLMHVGHLEHFEQAKMHGDFLVVSVVADKYITKRKPIYDEKARLRLVSSIKCVNTALLCTAPGPEEIIAQLKPNVYVRGSDYEGKEMPESKLLREMGISVKYTQSIPPRTGDIIREMGK